MYGDKNNKCSFKEFLSFEKENKNNPKKLLCSPQKSATEFKSVISKSKYQFHSINIKSAKENINVVI